MKWDSRSRVLHVPLIVALSSSLFLTGLGMSALRDPDETRYAEIGREMLESGDFIVPTLNYTPYLDKPPLAYWAICAAYKVFGVNEFAARFIPAFCGFLGVMAVYLFGRVLFDEGTAFRGAIVLCTTSLYFFLSRMLVTDMVLTLFVTLAAGLLYLAWKRGARWLVPAYVAMGLAAMTKGPVGVVLPALPIGLMALWKDGIGGIRRLISPGGVLAFLIVWAPWHIAIYFVRPEFFPHFFLGENLLGFTKKGIHHARPAYYTIGHLLLGFLPWTLFLPATIEAFFSRDRKDQEAWAFCLLWLAGPMAIFTLSISKLVTYVLPCMPPLALMVGAAIPRATTPRLPVRIVTCLLGAALCGGAAYAAFVFAPRLTGIVSEIRGLSIIALVSCIVLTVVLARSAGRWAFSLAMLLLPACLIYGSMLNPEVLMEFLSGRQIASEIAERGDFHGIATYGQQHPSMCFYLRSRQMFVDHIPGQYWFGLHLTDSSDRFISAREFATMAARQSGIYCVVRESNLDRFRALFHGYFRYVDSFRHEDLEYLFVSTGKPAKDASCLKSLPYGSLVRKQEAIPMGREGYVKKKMESK